MRKSRLARKEEARNIRQAILYGGLTFLIALALIFLGIPALIKMAIFLGNLRSSSLPVETKDIMPPPPPRINPLPEATNSAQINLKGFAEPGSTIKIFISDLQEKEVVADQEGNFEIANLKLTTGKNEIYATATDRAGNVSQESNQVAVFYDQEPPELNIVEPTKEEMSGGENKVTIKGITEEGATVHINDHMVIVDSEGNFQYPLVLKEGKNQIVIRAIDRAGNETKEEREINYSP